jgi:hypothetical protein
LYLFSVPQAPTIPSRSLVIYRDRALLCRHLLHLLCIEAANCNGCAAKMIPGDLELYGTFRSTTPVTASKAMMMGWWIR